MTVQRYGGIKYERGRLDKFGVFGMVQEAQILGSPVCEIGSHRF
jgi:hypothetical protein